MKVFTEVIAQGSQKATTQSQVNDKYRLLLAIKKDSGLKHLLVGFTYPMQCLQFNIEAMHLR